MIGHLLRRTVPCALLGLVTLAGCARKHRADETTAGSIVLDWSTTQATRASMKTATVGTHVAKDLDYTAHPTDDTFVKLHVHLETAPVQLQEDGTTVDHDAPVALKVTIQDAGDFRISNGKCAGPDYLLGAPGAPPKAMLLSCYFHVQKPNYDTGFTLVAHGDGTVDDGMPAKK